MKDTGKLAKVLPGVMFPLRYWIGCFGTHTWTLNGYHDNGVGGAGYPFPTYRAVNPIQGPYNPRSLTYREEDMRLLVLLTGSLQLNWIGLEVISNGIPRVMRSTIGQPRGWELYEDTGFVAVKPTDPITERPDSLEKPRIPSLTALNPLPVGFALSEDPIVLCEMNIVMTMPLDIMPLLGFRKELFSYVPTLQRELWKIPKDYGQVVHIRIGKKGLERELFIIFDRSDDYDLGDPLAWEDGMTIVLKEANRLNIGTLNCLRPPPRARSTDWADACATVVKLAPIVRPTIIFMTGQSEDCYSCKCNVPYILLCVCKILL